jgi:hypothetical protein
MTRFFKETLGVEHPTAGNTAATGTRPLVEWELILEAPFFSDCCIEAKGIHNGWLYCCIIGVYYRCVLW